MKALKDQISEDMKAYMKGKDAIAIEAIRMLRSDIKNLEIELKKEIDDSDILKIVQSTVKKNMEAAEMFKNAGRADLVDRENRYTEVISKYLPKQLTAEELEDTVKSVVAEMKDGANNFGAVMKAVIAKVGSYAEGKRVSEAVKKIIGG